MGSPTTGESPKEGLGCGEAVEIQISSPSNHGKSPGQEKGVRRKANFFHFSSIVKLALWSKREPFRLSLNDRISPTSSNAKHDENLVKNGALKH